MQRLTQVQAGSLCLLRESSKLCAYEVSFPDLLIRSAGEPHTRHATLNPCLPPKKLPTGFTVMSYRMPDMLGVVTTLAQYRRSGSGPMPTTRI